MANLPFALFGAVAPTSQPTTGAGTPTFDPSSIKTEADLIAWLQNGPGFNDGKGGLTGLVSPAPFGNGGMNPYWSMANFYNVPLTHSTPRGSGQIHTSGTYYPPGAGGPVQPGSGSGSSGGGSGTPYVPPPVTVPPVQGTGGGFTGVPGMNGTPGGYGVTLLTPPPMGSGAQWRNTMKYGA